MCSGLTVQSPLSAYEHCRRVINGAKVATVVTPREHSGLAQFLGTGASCHYRVQKRCPETRALKNMQANRGGAAW